MRTVPFAPLDPALYRESGSPRARRGSRVGRRHDRGDGRPVAAGARRDSRQVRLRDRRARRRRRGVSAARSRRRLHSARRRRRALHARAPSSRRCAASAAAMLTAERTALNFLQRLSGIATLTRRFVDATGGAITILDTRKTTPTLRALEKYAVRAGGGTNHRGGLDDGILIKDNHIRLGGGVAAGGAADEGGAAGDADRDRGAEPRAGGRGDCRRRRRHPARQPVDRRGPRGGAPDCAAARRWSCPAA